MEQPDGAVIAASLETPATFGIIFDRYGSTLLRFLARRVDPAEAEGLLGEVFRIAFERRSTFDQDRESARPWLYGIAANLVAKHHRSTTRRLRASARVSALRRVDADPAERAVAAADAGTRWARVIEAIGALPEIDRQVLVALRLGGAELRGDRHGARHPHWDRALPAQPEPGPAGGPDRGSDPRHRRVPHPLRRWRSTMTDDLEPLRRSRPDRLLPDDPPDPEILARGKTRLMSAITAPGGAIEHRRTPAIYPRLAYRDEVAALEFLSRRVRSGRAAGIPDGQPRGHAGLAGDRRRCGHDRSGRPSASRVVQPAGGRPHGDGECLCAQHRRPLPKGGIGGRPDRDAPGGHVLGRPAL